MISSTRPTSPHRSSRQHLERTGVQRLPIGYHEHHRQGDFVLEGDGHLASEGSAKLTFSGIGLYHPRFLVHWRNAIGPAAGVDEDPPRFRLAPLLRAAMERGQVSGEHHLGRWTDVGTPQRLQALDRLLDPAFRHDGTRAGDQP